MSECPNPNCRTEGPHHHEVGLDDAGNAITVTVPHDNGVIFGRIRRLWRRLCLPPIPPCAKCEASPSGWCEVCLDQEAWSTH